MAFIEAYNTETGKKLPYLVPEHHIDHPLLGANLSRLPSHTAGQKKPDPVTVTTVTEPASTTTPTTKTPAAGDKKE